ncbi:MAG: hypothetical protein K6G15_07705 [Desulfovibrio sp.]|nr:hypothetical protein [Desulfovibrio sp.]
MPKDGNPHGVVADGIRKSALLSLEWSDNDFKQGIIILERQRQQRHDTAYPHEWRGQGYPSEPEAH